MNDIKSFKIPVYFIEGEFDYLVSSALAEKYFKIIDAPEKKLFKFTNSAHSPHFEEPKKFSKILFTEIIK
jgi:pimeloyl-ACP methyl ester carboxylesterase